MNKLLLILFLLVVLPLNVFALDNTSAEGVVDNFFLYLNSNDSKIYNYIDNSNSELKNNVKNYLGTMTSEHRIITTTNDGNGTYFIGCTISAAGTKWNISNINVIFNVKEVNGTPVITKTTFFDNLGYDNVKTLVGKIFYKIFIFVIVAAVGVVLVILGIVLTAKKRKPTPQNTTTTSQDNIANQNINSGN